jgi:hypothetical protein
MKRGFALFFIVPLSYLAIGQKIMERRAEAFEELLQKKPPGQGKISPAWWP